MAIRTYFVPAPNSPFFLERIIEFDYSAGLALSQQQKCIDAMHHAMLRRNNSYKILEISTKSKQIFGVMLSAIRLQINHLSRYCFLESVYQSSKKFDFGGPYEEIAFMEPVVAKRDYRLKNSGKLNHFLFDSRVWPLLPNPNFYDYLYISTLIENFKFDQIKNFNAFTDFAFSSTSKSKKEGVSFNCQARSVAIFLGLLESHNFSEIHPILEKLATDLSRIRIDINPTLF